MIILTVNDRSVQIRFCSGRLYYTKTNRAVNVQEEYKNKVAMDDLDKD